MALLSLLHFHGSGFFSPTANWSGYIAVIARLMYASETPSGFQALQIQRIGGKHYVANALTNHVGLLLPRRATRVVEDRYVMRTDLKVRANCSASLASSPYWS